MDHEWIKNGSRNSCATVLCGTRTPLFPEAMAHIEIILQEKAQVVIGVAPSALTLVLNETGVHSPLSSVDGRLVCVWFDSGPHIPVRSSRAFHADDRGHNVELERGRRTVAAI